MNLKPATVYLDEDLLVVDKPSGMLTIRDGYDPEKPYLKAVLQPVYGNLWIVHRLDKLTSGLVVLARNEAAHRNVNTQFSAHTVKKVYWAIVYGVPVWERVEIDKPLRTNVGRRKRTVVDHKNGKPAKTTLQVLRRFKQYTLVEARPQTGRTHQIRAHLYDLGHPILGDPLYGSGGESKLIQRLALHARSITLRHPASRDKVSFHALEGEDFVKSLLLMT